MAFLYRLQEAGCIIRDKLHIYCPGCGGTRAFIALLKLHIRDSLAYNPLVILFILDLIATLTIRVVDARYSKKKHYRLRIAIQSFVLAFIVFFTVFRNYMLLVVGVDMLGDFSK